MKKSIALFAAALWSVPLVAQTTAPVYDGSSVAGSPGAMIVQTTDGRKIKVPVEISFVCDANGLNCAPASKGSATIATGQVSVGTTATLIRAVDAGRTSISVIVGSANACAFGNSGVTLTTGYLLPATAGASDTTATSAALYGVCTAITPVSYKAILP